MKKLIAILMAVMLMLGVSGCSLIEEIFEEVEYMADDILEDVFDSADDVFDELEDILR